MLTGDQKQHLIDEGYLHIPGAVPRAKALDARRAINADLGARGMDPARLTEYAARSYCPELKASPAIRGLFDDSPVQGMVESLLGMGNVQPVGEGQVALRFPKFDAPHRDPPPHIDGIPTATNGVPPGTLSHFTLLVGVLLSGVPDKWAGNFTVFPGSHRRLGEYFRGHDPKEMAGGMPPVELGEAKQMVGWAGDVVIAHYLTGHGIAPNASSDIRYACFFRVRHARHHGYRPEAVRDMWLDWDGLHPLLGRA